MTKKIRVLYELKTDGPEPVAAFCSAVAVGEDTVATADVSVEMTGHGRVTITSGTATAEATATTSSSTDGFAYATAQTEVFTASDILRTSTTTATGSGESEDFSWWSETSLTRFFSIDIDGVDLGKGPVRIDRTSSDIVVSQPETLDGNVATLDADATVLSGDSYALVVAEVLAVEDQLSSTSAMVLVA